MLPLLWFVVVSEIVLYNENFSCAISVNDEGHVSIVSILQMREEVFFLFFSSKVDNTDDLCLNVSYFFQMDYMLVEDHVVFSSRR